MRKVVPAAVFGFIGGVAAERYYAGRKKHVIPVYCAEEGNVVESLRDVVGTQNVHSVGAVLRGMRVGEGEALCVVQPGSLQEAVEVVRSCARHNVPIIPQGQNTGLTGGSVPRPSSDAPRCVVLSTRRLSGVVPVDGGKSLLCFAGAGIADAARVAAEWQRDSHSVLGSFFLNPTVGAGVSFGSGGTQLRKGPVYTERVLYVRIGSSGQVEIVDTLGLKLVDATKKELALPEVPIKDRLALLDDIRVQDESKRPNLMSILVTSVFSKFSKKDAVGSDSERYRKEVCKNDSNVTRYNGDTRGPDAVRSEGKVLLLCSIHDTFERPKSSETLWISLDSFAKCRELRQICLENDRDLPSSLEYMNTEAVDVISKSGALLCQILNSTGGVSSNVMPYLWYVKDAIESIPISFASSLPDWSSHWISRFLPVVVLPSHIQKMTSAPSFQHHVIVTNDDFDGSRKRLRQRIDNFVASNAEHVRMHECTSQEAGMVKVFRFVAAPAFQAYCTGYGYKPLNIDFALPKNYEGSFSQDGSMWPVQPVTRMVYAHFGCNVVHEDIAFGGEISEKAIEQVKDALVLQLRNLGGAIPAEHGHGTEYEAPDDAKARWMRMDPTNMFNPGIGGMSAEPNYGFFSNKKQ